MPSSGKRQYQETKDGHNEVLLDETNATTTGKEVGRPTVDSPTEVDNAMDTVNSNTNNNREEDTTQDEEGVEDRDRGRGGKDLHNSVDEDRARATKRIKKTHPRRNHNQGRRLTNIFIDAEAEVEGTDEEENEEEEDMDMTMFIDDRDIDHQSSEIIGSRSAAHPSRETLATTLHFDWDSLLDRAYHRARSNQNRGLNQLGNDADDNEYTIATNDNLWVVPCQPGLEEKAIYSIFNRANHPTSPHITAPSAMFNPSHPGFIYIEASNQDRARDTIKGIAGVSSALLKLVPHERRRHAISNSPRNLPLWVRIKDSRRKWRKVNGTVGLVVPLTNAKNFVEAWTVVVAHKDGFQASAPWVWQSVNLDDIRFHINLGELPTVKDIQRFSGCKLVNECHLEVLFERIYRTNLRPGARVCVTSGDFIGCLGKIVSATGFDADVDIGGTVQTIPLSAIRRHFVIGDQATIITLPWKGTTGWIVNVEDEHVTLWCDSNQTEYRVASIEVEFFISSFRYSFLLPPTVKPGRISQYDRFARFKGCHVYITGKHPLKGQQGRIQDTHPDGRVWVQMESINSSHRTTIFRHAQVSLIQDETELLYPLIDREGYVPQRAPFSHPMDASVSTGTPTLDNDGNDMLLEQLDSMPVVDEAMSLPDIDLSMTSNAANDPYWLVDACFPQRIKLVHAHDQNLVVQLVGRGLSRGTVTVRDRQGLRELSQYAVMALPPRQKNDVVVVLSGEQQGNTFKVVEVGDLQSVVKKPGQVLRKKEQYPKFNNDVLVQAFGAYK